MSYAGGSTPTTPPDAPGPPKALARFSQRPNGELTENGGMRNLVASNSRALVERSHVLIDRGHAAVVRSRDRKERSRRNLPQSLEQVVWMRELISEHDAAKEAVLSFVDLAKSCGLSATETLTVLRNMVHTAKTDAGDTQKGGALEQAVMRWGKAACSR